MAGYLGASPVPQTIQKKQSFIATASQTTFTTTGYTDGQFINVYLNGVRLINGTDYTATNGSDIVLTTGASASDVLDFETFNEFTLVDQTLETPTFRTSATLKNDTEEDTDGGRESTLIFKGEQSGGEISTLAEIEASHDGTADDQKGDLIFRTNDGSDNDAPTERARIDSSGNLLVGTTDDNPNNNSAGSAADNGIKLGPEGLVSVAAYDNPTQVWNRTGTDGTIADIRKDGSTVGSIGASGGDVFIGTGDTGIRFKDDTDDIRPWNTSTNALTDGTIDLGDSISRFKDLYLSGGAYIGGTVAANYLDDYEEGTFTPTMLNAGGSISYSQQFGYYTKVGDIVSITLVVTFGNITSSTNHVRVTSLPFTIKNTGVYFSVPSLFMENGFNATGAANGGFSGIGINNSTEIGLYTQQASTGNNYVEILYNMMNTGSSNTNCRVRLSMTYHVA